VARPGDQQQRDIRLKDCFGRTITEMSTATLLSGPNYNEWVIEAKAQLRADGLWGVTSGGTPMPLKPMSSETQTVDEKIRNDPNLPESTKAEYMQQFYRYHHEYVNYRISLEKASGKIVNMLDLDLKRKYSDDKWDYDPQGLWNEIKKERK